MNTALHTAAATLPTFTVKELATKAGVSETTARKFVNELVGKDEITHTGTKGTYTIFKDEAPSDKKVYKKNADAVRLVRKSRWSKADITVQSINELSVKDPFGQRVLVETALGAEVDELDDEDKWASICLTHGSITFSPYILDAWWIATHPSFCKSCKGAMPADAVAAAKNLPSTRKANKKEVARAAA